MKLESKRGFILAVLPYAEKNRQTAFYNAG